VRATREEVLTIFRVWQSDGALLRFDFSFREFAASLRGKVRFISDSKIGLLSDDTFSELTLALNLATHFEYADPRDFPDEAKEFMRGLVVFFSADEFIELMEFK
jgi:hypothetical protein